jgi:histidinol-phosphate aminotransferase
VLSLAIASSILERSDHIRKTIEMVRKERSRVSERLEAVDGIDAFRSDANFLFIEAGGSYPAVTRALADAGLVVKLIGNVAGHRGCMRVTIGTREMNDRFLQVVEGALR